MRIFFIFESTRLRDKIAVVVRMGGERRFAPLLRIGAPRTILKQLFWRGGVLCGDSFDFFGTRIRFGALSQVPGGADWCGLYLY